MRVVCLSLMAAVLLSGCDKRPGLARDIVTIELRNPATIKFRNIRTKGSEEVVCGEVMASDEPQGGWRPFVAYTGLGRAAVSPTSEISADAEMGNPLLKGAAAAFTHTCD